MSDPRPHRSRRALLDATLRLLDDHLLDEITTADIALEAGVSRATLFRHFASKEALLDEIARDQIDALVAFTLPIYDQSDRQTSFHALCDYVEEHRAVWTTLLTGGAAAAMRDELRRVSLVAAVGRGENDWVPVDLAVASTTSVIIEGLTWWLTQPAGKVSIDQAALIMYRLVLEPLPSHVPSKSKSTD